IAFVDPDSFGWPDPGCTDFMNWNVICERSIGGVPTAKTNHVQLADFNGDAASDLLIRVHTEVRYYLGLPGCVPILPPPRRPGGDENDGQDELPYIPDMDGQLDRLRRQAWEDPCWNVVTVDRLHALSVGEVSPTHATLG